ncbi:hypothetical protein THAOC_14031 [Thalassiosira oceanica]|uniref:Uncharacterized protein n=1 Tax=Thalassiosira oceanica TaxID=159749 RepID=K0SW20_THAOC|nr:hypothetical protein THAOC_14031 [Thalassiosira oceanica]|eukprot:EJK65151.1 hypothetical protein THAOC_14031 [Thalassiosira oceanica]
MIRWGVKKRVPPDKYWGRLYYVGAGSKHWYRQRRAGPTIRGRLLMPAKTGETDGGDDRQLVEETTSFWSFKWRRLYYVTLGRQLEDAMQLRGRQMEDAMQLRGKYSLRRHMEDAMQLRTIFIEDAMQLRGRQMEDAMQLRANIH